MRKTLFVLLVFASVISQGQNIPFNPETKEIVYDSVYEVTGLKDELYTKAKVWVSDIFKSSLRVVDADDKETGMLICKGNFKYNVVKGEVKGKGKRQKVNTYNIAGNADFVLKIFLKDNRCRIVVDGVKIPMLEEATAAGLGDLKTDWAMLNSLTIKKEDDTLEGSVSYSNYQSRDAAVNQKISDIMHSLKSALLKKGDFDF